MSDEQHTSDCAALRCAKEVTIEIDKGEWVTRPCGMLRDSHLATSRYAHLYEPGPCNCELGRLRARVQELENEQRLMDKVLQRELDRAKRILELEDWQRRAVPHLKCYNKIHGPSDWAGYCSVDDLIAEAEDR